MLSTRALLGADVGGVVGGAIAVVIAVSLAVLLIAAIVSIVSSPLLDTGGKALWIVAVIAFPFLGSLAWFLWGRSHGVGAGPRA